MRYSITWNISALTLRMWHLKRYLCPVIMYIWLHLREIQLNLSCGTYVTYRNWFSFISSMVDIQHLKENHVIVTGNKAQSRQHVKTQEVRDHYKHCSWSNIISSEKTNPMGHSLSWEADSRSVVQKIPHLLRNLEIYYHAHKRPPLHSILNQVNPVHTLTFYFLQIHFIIILPSIYTSHRYSD
jgi:hypothetical protein